MGHTKHNTITCKNSQENKHCQRIGHGKQHCSEVIL